VLDRPGSGTIAAPQEIDWGWSSGIVDGSSYDGSVGECRLLTRRQARGPLRFLAKEMDLFETDS